MKFRIFVQEGTTGRAFEIEGEGKAAAEVVDAYNEKAEVPVRAITAVCIDESGSSEEASKDSCVQETPDEA